MNRMLFAALTLFLIRDCDVAAPRPGTIIKGMWGGDNAGLLADDTSAHIHIKCTYGDIHQAIVIGTNGQFDVPGEYLLRAYPVAVGPTMPAQFKGTVNGFTMTLTVTVQDTVADTTAVLGPVKLLEGAQPKMWPCPICFGKNARVRPTLLTEPPVSLRKRP